MRGFRFVVAILLALSLSGLASPALAKAKMEVAAVEVNGKLELDKERDRHVRTTIRRLASHSAKHLDFGKHGKVEVTLIVKELTIEQGPDVLRITCTLVGKLAGGGSARSRISFGGKPDKKKQLEKQVLSSVTDGVMTRLAELARAKEKLADKKKEKEKESG